MLKAGLLAPAAAAAASHGLGSIGAAAIQVAQKELAQIPVGAATDSSKLGAGRERLLLDFGWRFHFGNANDSAKDFGFGADNRAIFRRQAIL
jgi:beta-galactosidase